MTPSHTTTHSADETTELGARLGRALRAGDLILLQGEIGAGKTTFVKGVGAGLGVTDTIVSPTFMLHCLYDGRLTLNHFDFYRLDDPSEALIFGLDQALDDHGVALVEWAERLPDALRPPYLTIELALDEALPDERVLAFSPRGGDWAARVEELLA